MTTSNTVHSATPHPALTARVPAVLCILLFTFFSYLFLNTTGVAMAQETEETPISGVQRQVTGDDASVLSGQQVTTRGVVTAVYGDLFFIQDAGAGPWSGVGVYHPGHGVVAGDQIRVTGRVTEYYDLTEIEPARYEILARNSPLPTPVSLPVQAVNDEQWEGVLVQVRNVTVTSPPDQYGEWTVRDESGLTIVDDKGIFYEAVEGQTIASITGVVDHAFGTYRLIPRGMEDIGDAVSAPQPPQDMSAIYAVQGGGNTSPRRGERVSVEGIVTAVSVEGLFVQDPVGDGDPATSDGIFVYTGSRPAHAPGTCVLVRHGLVDEFYGKTELARPQRIDPVQTCPAARPEPVLVPLPGLPVNSHSALEPYEGMLVTVARTHAVVQGPTKRFSNGDEEIGLVLAETTPHLPGGRVYQSRPEDVSSLFFLSNLAGAELPRVAWGETVQLQNRDDSPLLAVVDYNFEKYQFALLPEQFPVIHAAGIEQSLPEPTATGEFSICTFNLNGMGRGRAQHPQPTVYERELQRRAAAIAQALQGCTLIGLQETGTPEDAENLASVLAQSYGLDYTAVAIEGPNSRSPEFPLTNSLLARASSRGGEVEILSAALSQACSSTSYGIADPQVDCAAGQYPLFNRPPLIVDVAVSGEWNGVYELTVVVNHWKSKSGDEPANLERRTRQAAHVASIVQKRLDADPAAHIVVLGDLNDYYPSEPIRILQDQTDPPLFHTYELLPSLDRYTYIFNGASQVLDHVLISAGMQTEFAGIEPIRINADFPAAGNDNPPSYLHVSDHDPVRLVVRPQGSTFIARLLGIILTLFDIPNPFDHDFSGGMEGR